VFTDRHPAAAQGRFEHQQIDQSRLFAPITKWTGTLTSTDAYAVLDRAFAEVASAPPGPVHLDCAGDCFSAEPPVGDTNMFPGGASDKGIAALSDRARTLVANARRPLVVAGLGARRPEDAAAIRAFCERWTIPAMVTYKAKGVVPDHHPLFAGVFMLAAVDRPVLDDADLIIAVGLDPVELLPKPWTSSAPVIYGGGWPVADSHVPFAEQTIGGIAEFLDQLAGAGPRSTWKLSDVVAHAHRMRQSVEVPVAGFSAQDTVRMTAALFARDGIVTVDAGAHMFPATMLWPADEPNQLLISNGLSTMGFALPAAIGAALCDRGRTVVALTGDGGLLMCAGELLTAARENLRIVVVVFNDASLSLIDIKQQARGLPTGGVELGLVDWSKIAAGFGVTPFAATCEAELESALDRATECDGPVLIDVRVDGTGYGEMMRRIRG
jgi:acetolactate synthase-1/2/3 large subunit